MIAQLRGRLVRKTPTSVVIETGGVGFHILVPVSTFEALGAADEETVLLTYLAVREDALQLFGFATEDERDLFLLLISVSGIGPRLAQGILSGIRVEHFKQGVREGDTAVLTRIPGVGKKTAERLVVELRDRIDAVQRGTPSAAVPSMTQIHEEAILALVSLGYKRTQAEQSVQAILRRESGLSLEVLLRKALSQINR
ncbi:MAG TPA: Holliday junction branch migration protein RuvA [bacterium]|nr:Holliday junction branch migration protein RuvA [bacterium]